MTVAALGPRFSDALVYAAELHARQYRKGGRVPYVSHLLAVTALVLEDGGDEDAAIAALLHDAVEDQGGAPTLERVRERFGERVATMVEALTDYDVHGPRGPSSERKARYLATLPSKAPDVLRVSLADKLHNARCVLRDYREHGEAVWSRFSPGTDQVQYYRAVVEAFRPLCDSVLVDELDRVVEELERLAGAADPQAATR